MSALKSGAGAIQDKKEKAGRARMAEEPVLPARARIHIARGVPGTRLAEIRRVYIIDPSNAIASDFEKQFEALAQLKRVETVRVYPSAAAQGKVITAGGTTDPLLPDLPAAIEPTPVVTEEVGRHRREAEARTPANHAQVQAETEGAQKS